MSVSRCAILTVVTMWCGTTAAYVLPPMWDQVPQDLSEYPLIDGVTSINPWNYIQRIGLMKIMMKVSSNYQCRCSNNSAIT